MGAVVMVRLYLNRKNYQRTIDDVLLLFVKKKFHKVYFSEAVTCKSQRTSTSPTFGQLIVFQVHDTYGDQSTAMLPFNSPR